MELPKVNIAVIGIVCSSLGGMVWYASEQASIIANLEETVSVLDAKSNTTEKINMIRDIDQNKDNIDDLWNDVDSLAGVMTDLIKLQARVAILEKTVEFIEQLPFLAGFFDLDVGNFFAPWHFVHPHVEEEGSIHLKNSKKSLWSEFPPPSFKYSRTV